MVVDFKEIKIVPMKEKLNGELSQKIYYNCAFCRKSVGLYPYARILCERLSGQVFHCDFCIRHNLHTRGNRNFLPLSMRAIVGYYYYKFYFYTSSKHNSTNRATMMTQDLEEMLQKQRDVGNINPVFLYDPDTMLWFVDFNKVGKGRRKIRVEEVKKTVLNMLACFNMPIFLPDVNMAKFYQKYADAIDVFYARRERPKGRRLLAPTLAYCNVNLETKTPFDFEQTRDFTMRDMIVKAVAAY